MPDLDVRTQYIFRTRNIPPDYIEAYMGITCMNAPVPELKRLSYTLTTIFTITYHLGITSPSLRQFDNRLPFKQLVSPHNLIQDLESSPITQSPFRSILRFATNSNS